jgi:hypothetical protein
MSTDLEKESARQRKANQRAREKGLPEPYPPVNREDVVARREQNEANLNWAKEQDTTGRYYKAECRSCVDLLAIYEGQNVVDKDVEDEEDGKKKKEKKENRLNPSQYKITIRATEWNGILLEPNCDAEFKILKEVDEVVSFQRWLDLRDKARKNLLWLGRLLGYGLFHSVHQYVCDQFVSKDFTGLYFPEYTIDDFHDMFRAQKRFANDGITPCREMILLESRGAYKSTIDGIDAIQWLINAPDVRIMVITGVKSLAKKFAKQIKRSFYLPAKGIPTAFNLLFPEYVLTGVDGRSEQPLDCPAANFNQKEPNLWVTSIESSNTGDHCDVRKADDVVTPKNSADKELREALKFEFDGTDDVLDQWGFSDVIGTRYFTDDWYGTRQLPNEDTGEVAPFRYSCRGCWTLSPEDVLDYKSGKLSIKDILNQQRAKLTFPYKLSWSELRRTYNKKGERSFKNQQLNEATDANEDSMYINEFNEDVLRSHCYPKESAPKVGDIFQTWDISYGDKKTSDFSVGVTAMVYKNKKDEYALCILEIIFDKWKSSELSFHILQFYKRWPATQRILIEKANGADWLFDNLKLTAGKYGVLDITSKIHLEPVDTSTNAKRNRVKSLELLLSDDRLHFVNGSWLDETFKQLTRFTGEKSTATRKDDIPDGLSFLIKFLPRTALMQNADPKEVEKEAEEMAKKATLKAWKERMFGGSAPTAPPSVTQTTPEPQRDPRRAMLDKILPPGMRS